MMSGKILEGVSRGSTVQMTDLLVPSHNPSLVHTNGIPPDPFYAEISNV